MTADATRRNWSDLERVRSASEQAQRKAKQDIAARDLLKEAIEGYRNQPKAWNPEQWVMRAELLLGGM